MTANEKGRLPKFGPQSAAIREASGIIRTGELGFMPCVRTSILRGAFSRGQKDTSRNASRSR